MSPIFRPEPQRLEDRRLLAGASVPHPHAVEFAPIRPVTQQAGTAMVTLTRNHAVHPGETVQVQLTTGASPAVGVNLPVVEQLITFLPGQSTQVVRFPITRGAPNPGEVDVPLTLTPVGDPGDTGPPESAVLAIRATGDTTAPRIVAGRVGSQGIELTFSEPMDPATAGRVGSYVATGAAGGKNGGPAKPVPLQSAVYDAASRTVTLVPGRPIGNAVITVASSPSAGSAHAARGKGRVAAAGAITDLAGNAIGAPGGSGRFAIRIGPGGSRRN